MKTAKKISLAVATLININIVIGGAFFLSARELMDQSGLLASFTWLAVGVMLFPLAFVLAQLSKQFSSSGGLYHYSRETLGEFWGFLSGWGYFIGTAAGNALILHAFRRLLTNIGVVSSNASGLVIDSMLVLCFSTLTLFNIEFLSRMQTLLTILKSIPFVSVCIAACFTFSAENIALPSSHDWSAFFAHVPIVLFAYIGLEACCSIGHLIEDGKKNTARAILISLSLIVASYTVTQFLLFGIHGRGVLQPFVALAEIITCNKALASILQLLITTAILSSFLGGFYSMFYANNWNMYALAEKKRLPFAQVLTSLSPYQSPWLCIVMQALLIIGFLALTYNIDTLMTMSDFGIVIAYVLSSFAFLTKRAHQVGVARIVGYASLVICGYLLCICFDNLIKSGILIALPYFALMIVGIASYVITTHKGRRTS